MLGFLYNLLFGGKAPPERVVTDRVVPVGFFDNTILFRTFVMYTLFVFDDVLEPQQVRSSLERVISRPGWNKMGARLRRSEDGDFEHHIPASYSEDRPAIGYDHLDLSDIAAEDHPAASKIPSPPTNGRPAVVGDPDELAELYSGPNVPSGLDDYIYSDRPEMGIRIVSFKDKTVVVMHWIHLAFDAIAQKSLFDAWMLMLAGREDEILEPLAPDEYILEDLGKNVKEEHALADVRVAMPGLVSWVFRNIYTLAIGSKQHRMVCVPAAFLNKLRVKALAELAAVGDKDTEFVSDGDVLLAWTTRIAKKNLPQDSENMIAVQQAYQWRPALKDLIPNGRPFLSNCVGFLVTLVPTKDVYSKPLSYLASKIRASIKEQGSREQIEAYASYVRMDPANRAPPFFGGSTMQLIMFSNWQKANMYGLDLSATATKPRETPLLPSYVQSVQGPYKFNDGFIVVGKDPGGNYWLSAYRVNGLWDMMAEDMAKAEI